MKPVIKERFIMNASWKLVAFRVAWTYLQGKKARLFRVF
jgi:hypothetical protein